MNFLSRLTPEREKRAVESSFGLRSSVILMLMLVFVFVGALTVSAEDRVVIGQQADAPGLHTLVDVDVYAFERINMISEPLVFIEHDLSLSPHLAVDWKISEDAMQIEMELREGVLWHHGREFVAEDVSYTYEWVLDEDNPAANRDLYAAIEEIEIIDDYHIIFHLSEPYTFLINNMARIGIVPYDYHEEVGHEEFRQAPIGTGPYVHEEWADDDYHILTAFDDYWGGEPNFEVVDFRPIPEDSSRLLAFEAGEIDMYQGGVVPEELARLEEDPDVVVDRTTGTGYDYLGMNLASEFNPEAMASLDLRLAITHAVNREAIVEHVQRGIGSPGKSQIIPEMPHFNPDIDYPEYDPDLAREYFAESGLEELTLQLYVHEDPVNMEIAEIVAYELGQIGIEVDVNVEEWGAFLDRILGTNEYDLFILGWTGQVDPDRASYRQFHSQGTMNMVNFSNERVDELLERGRALDPNSQESIENYQEVQQILLEEHPKAFIAYQESVALIQPWFEGFRNHPYGANTWLQLVDDIVRVEQ